MRDKARSAFYSIKRNIQHPKIVKSVKEPISLSGGEVWGPLSNNEFTKWDKYPIEIVHEFCKTVLQVQRKPPDDACRSELGQCPLLIEIEKRAIKFYNHLKTSDPKTFHHTAQQCQEIRQEKSLLSQLVLRLSSLTQTNFIEPQHSTQPAGSEAQFTNPNQLHRASAQHSASWF